MSGRRVFTEISRKADSSSLPVGPESELAVVAYRIIVHLSSKLVPVMRLRPMLQMVTSSAPREFRPFWRRFSEGAPSKMNHVLTAAVNRTLRFHWRFIHAYRPHVGEGFRIWFQGWCNLHEGPYGDSTVLTAKIQRAEQGAEVLGGHRRQTASKDNEITRSRDQRRETRRARRRNAVCDL